MRAGVSRKISHCQKNSEAFRGAKTTNYYFICCSGNGSKYSHEFCKCWLSFTPKHLDRFKHDFVNFFLKCIKFFLKVDKKKALPLYSRVMLFWYSLGH